MHRFIALLLFLLTGCGFVDYDELPVGRFDGTLFVMWVGEGSDLAGDGRFVFVPMPNDPLVFYRENPDATVAKIAPQLMYTDGGSVPRVAQVFNGLSPWGYAPGYMVHDWLFQAKHCVTDGTATAKEQVVAQMSFIESAEVLGEAIKTLIAENKVRPNDVAPDAISSAVAGPISRNQWKRSGACPTPRIAPEHLDQVNNAIGRFNRSRRALPKILGATPDGVTAAIVSVVQF